MPKKKLFGSPLKNESLRDTPENSPRAIPTKQSPSVGSFGNVTMKEPSGDVASSLDVVCYHCLCELSVWKCIKSIGPGSCREPSHDKVQLSSCYKI